MAKIPLSFGRRTELETKTGFSGSESLTSVLPKVKVTRLWQILFDFYRENEGDLSRMHSILMDFKHCSDIFNKLHNNKTAEFVFSFDGYATTFMSFKDYKELPFSIYTGNLKLAISHSKIDYVQI